MKGRTHCFIIIEHIGAGLSLKNRVAINPKYDRKAIEHSQ
jgi:hypothetical protein